MGILKILNELIMTYEMLDMRVFKIQLGFVPYMKLKGEITDFLFTYYTEKEDAIYIQHQLEL